MSRNLALSVSFAVGSFVLLVASVVVVWRGAPAETGHTGSAVSPSAREAELASKLAQRDVEIAALRSDVDRLTLSLGEQRTVAEPVAAAEQETPPGIAESAAPKAATDVAALLRSALPDRYGQLTAEEAAALTTLDLRGAAITDADLALIATLPSLQTLNLSGTAVTDAGLAYLRNSPQLSVLDLRGTQVTGAGVGQLPALALTALHLTDTKVTGEALHWLPPMPNLQTLKLNRLAFGDDAVGDLALFPAVRHLELDGTALSDVGLSKLLAQNTALKRIEIRGTSVTPDAVAQFRNTYPNVEFVIEDGAGLAHFAR